MVKILFIFIAFVILVIVSYFLAIFMVQKIMRKSRIEAESYVNRKVEEIIAFFSSQPQRTLNFDVMIGANGVSIRDEIVHKYFEGFYKIWEDWYFYRCYFSNSGNVLVYNFRVYNPVNENLGRIRTLQRVREVAEKALTQHFHDMGVYDIHVDDFVAVNLHADCLLVVIACNEAGFAEIRKLRDSVH